MGNWYTIARERDEVSKRIILKQTQLIRLQRSYEEIYEEMTRIHDQIDALIQII
jgi:hypothetical protein